MAGSRDHLHFVLPGAPPPASAGPESMGSKAYGLSRLAALGLPVPPAFVLGTPLCRAYFERGGRLPEDLQEVLAYGLTRLESSTGRTFGSSRRPLLVAVRSGAPVSMPGMLDTVLNIGLCEKTLRGFLSSTGNPRLTQDCYRRLIRDFAAVVRGVEVRPFEKLISLECAREGVAGSSELDTAALGRIAEGELEQTLALTGRLFSQDPVEQLHEAVEAVFQSWESKKAKDYRRLNGIDDNLATAVTVQAMVFGNSGSDSGAGVGFTRDPATGENRPYLDFLFNAQGEDVVSGRHKVHDPGLLARRFPKVAAELDRIKFVLEREFRGMQDFEFTVENGRLYLLQTREGKRTPWAALKIAVDMVREDLISAGEAIESLRGLELDKLERLRIAPETVADPIATAVAASLGVAAGEVVFDPKRAADLHARGQEVILVREDITTEDFEGLAGARGVLTANGGRTSHAAVVARQLGKVCLVGCSLLRFDGSGHAFLGEHRLSEGDTLTLDADRGRIYAGRLPLIQERPEAELAEVARWRGKTQAV